MENQVIKSPSQMEKMIKVTSPLVWFVMIVITAIVVAVLYAIFTQTIETTATVDVFYCQEEIDVSEEEEMSEDSPRDIYGLVEATTTQGYSPAAIFFINEDEYDEGGYYEDEARILDDEGNVVATGMAGKMYLTSYTYEQIQEVCPNANLADLNVYPGFTYNIASILLPEGANVPASGTGKAQIVLESAKLSSIIFQ